MTGPAATGVSPYEVILGETFASLHPHVRRAHLPPLRAEGTIDVEHGRQWLDVYSAAAGALPWSFGWICVFNDLIWWPVFWGFAVQHAREPLAPRQR